MVAVFLSTVFDGNISMYVCFRRVSLEPFYKISQDIKYHVISYLSLYFINLNIS